MKKVKMIFASIAVVFFLGSGFASIFANTSMDASIVLQDVVKTGVPVENLPEAVTDAISESKWKEWTISKASAETKDNETYYIVTLVKNDDKNEVKITPEGDFIE